MEDHVDDDAQDHRAKDLPDLVRSRRAARSFDATRSVPQAVLLELVDLATRAPSAGATQGWDFLVLRDPTDVAAYWSATTDPRRVEDRWLRGMRTAPALVVAWSREDAYRERYARPDKRSGDHAPPSPEQRWPVPYWHVDTGMAVALLLLGAAHHGLGACPFAVPTARVAAVRAAFDVPADRTPVMAVALGTPAPHPDGPPPGGARPSRRRPLADVAHDGRFGRPLAGCTPSRVPPGGAGASTSGALLP